MGCGFTSRQKVLKHYPVIEILDKNTNAGVNKVMSLEYSHLGEKRILYYIRKDKIREKLSLNIRKVPLKRILGTIK